MKETKTIDMLHGPLLGRAEPTAAAGCWGSVWSAGPCPAGCSRCR